MCVIIPQKIQMGGFFLFLLFLLSVLIHCGILCCHPSIHPMLMMTCETMIRGKMWWPKELTLLQYVLLYTPPPKRLTTL